MKPFYYHQEDVWLLRITLEQADILYKDVQLWDRIDAAARWIQREYPWKLRKPSTYHTYDYAIQVNPPEDEESTQL